MSKAEEEKIKETSKAKGGCLKHLGIFLLVCLGVLLVFLTWLNGPGYRWLAPKVAVHFLGEKNVGDGLSFGGTLLGGVKVYDLDIRTEGALERLVIDKLETDYRVLEVIKGKVRGISGEGVHADIRLIETPKEEGKPPVDFAELGKTLNGVREKILGLDLDIKEVSVSVKKEGELVVGIAKSGLSHKVGEDLIGLELGMITDSEGRTLRPQDARLVWDPEKFSVERLDLLPVLGVRDVEVFLPENGEIAANGKVRLGDSVLQFDVGKGISDVRLDMIEGELDFGKLLGGFGLGIPVKGKLKSLALGLEKIYPDWQQGVGTAELYVEDFSYDEWDVATASVGVVLEDGAFSAKLVADALGSEIRISAGGGFNRDFSQEMAKYSVEKISGDLEIAKVEEVLNALDGKFDLGMDFSEFPESKLSGGWEVDLSDGFQGAGGDVTLSAKEADATPIRVNAYYEEDLATLRNLDADGMKSSGKYFIAEKRYEATKVFTDFDGKRMEPWIKGAGIETPATGVLSMKWEGSGDITANTHQGKLSGMNGVVNFKPVEGEETREPISLAGDLEYAWPGKVEMNGLVVQTQGQSLKLDALMDGGQLELEEFTWLDGEEELARGAGTLPVPEDFSKLDEFLANNTETMELKLSTETLALSKLRPWVPALDQIDESATGKVEITLAGSMAEPEVMTLVELRDISSPTQPDLPKMDVTLRIEAKDDVAKVSGEAIAPDYAPATLEAEMPFFPKKWAEDPELIKAAEVKGELNLPRIELSRFQSLIPGAEELGGVAEGRMSVAGTVGAPVIDGNISLKEGKFRMEGNTVPALSGINLDVQTDLQKVTIKGGINDVEGGNLRIDGSLGLKNAERDGLGDLDVSVKGRGLPAVRNEFIIVRANLDLSVKGGFTDAKVAGEIGIIDSVFYKDMELIPIGKPFLEPSAAKLPAVDAPAEIGSMVPPPFDNWTANVVVKTIDPILIRGNLGTGKVDAALRIEGKLGDPKPNGTVRLYNVVARLPFSTLEIREGNLTFTPQTGFDPILEIRGTAEPRPYRVDIYVYGRASDPQLALTSQPPLPENEIMTLLATGTTSSGLEDSQAATSRAMQLLIEEVRRGRFLFGKQLRPVLGLLDNVDFSLSENDPYDSESFNSARVKLSDKWYISAGLGEQGEQRVMAIYRLRFR
ncbi:MAG: translocation/assembly module TamB [Akkermansiaceae bacterium]|nr:translocation/assembly module TamB [Akkermansiaceae bacterium]